MTGLEKFILPDFNGGAVAIRFRKDQALFAQGTPADSVFYIQEGSVKIAVLSEQGKEAVVAILTAGDFCGEGCLAGQAVRMASVVAMTDGAATRIAKSTVVRMLHDNPEFSELFTAHLLARSVRVEADLVDHLFNSSEKRLARLLLLLANFGKEEKPAREALLMNKFRQLGFIEYNGSLKVHSSLLNMVLHEDQPRPMSDRP